MLNITLHVSSDDAVEVSIFTGLTAREFLFNLFVYDDDGESVLSGTLDLDPEDDDGDTLVTVVVPAEPFRGLAKRVKEALSNDPVFIRDVLVDETVAEVALGDCD